MADSMPGPEAVVSLREITAETVRHILDLSVAESQKMFVAPNAYSVAEAYFHDKAWFRAIYADETPVGFMMIVDDAETPEYFLWRFMIDERYQGLGSGRRAIDHLIAYVKTRPGAAELLVSCVPGKEGPEQFYRRLGFAPTGQMEDGEMVLKLIL
jgi:diamine N-acetyltransferase